MERLIKSPAERLSGNFQWQNCSKNAANAAYGSIQSFMDGVQRLAEEELSIIGSVFNVTKRKLDGQYGYGYGYGKKWIDTSPALLSRGSFL